MRFKKIFMMLTLATALFFSYNGNFIHAQDLEGDLIIKNSNSTEQDDDYTGLAEYISNTKSLTKENLAKASTSLSPFTNAMGWCVGAGISVLFAGVFVITIIDILYISIPPLRSKYLYSGDSQSNMNMNNAMGYDARYGYRNTMNNQPTPRPRQIISDEAVRCINSLGGNNAQQGVYPNNGMPQETSVKSVIIAYFKARAIFMIFLVITVIVLTSSILLGTGVNLAQWVLKILEKVNMSIAR